MGINEIDTLLGSPGRNVFYLGDNAVENPSDFYLGNGDKDYAVIKYFDPTSEDAVYLAGKPEDYTLGTFKEFYTLQVFPQWRRAFPNLVSYTRFVELMPWCLMLL